MIKYLILFYLLVSVILFIFRTIKSKKSYHDKYSFGEAIDYSTLWPLYIFVAPYFFYFREISQIYWYERG